MMSGEDGSRQVIEAMLACLAQVSLSAPLAVVVAVADDSSATAAGAGNAFRPYELANDFITLCFVEQVCQLDQVRHGSRSLLQREQPTDQLLDHDEHAEMQPSKIPSFHTMAKVSAITRDSSSTSAYWV